MTIDQLAHQDSADQLASCPDYNRWLDKHQEQTLQLMEEHFRSLNQDDGQTYDNLEDQLSH